MSTEVINTTAANMTLEDVTITDTGFLDRTTSNKKGKHCVYSEVSEFMSESTNVFINCDGAPRILLLADSHGKNMANKLVMSFGCDYDVQTIFKPDADMFNVVKDARELTTSFSMRDYLVILAGVNNVVNRNINVNWIPRCKKGICT